MGMSVVAEFTIEAEAFPLGSLFKAVPGITLELERIIPTNKTIIPYVWIQGAEQHTIQHAFGELAELDDFTIVDAIDEAYLVRLTWNQEYKGVLKAIAEAHITLLSGIGTSEQWTFEIRGDTRDTVAAFQRSCQEYNIPLRLTAIQALSEIPSGTEYDLTEAQREALLLAYERGYFKAPRDAALEEIAAELGITGQALGSRLRRGIQRLIANTLNPTSSDPNP